MDGPALAVTQFTLLVGAFVAALFFVVVAVARKVKASSSRNLVLLLGLSDAGKTSILADLSFGQTWSTHSSLTVNAADCTLPNSKKRIQLVDIPGHPRLRDQFVEHLPNAKAIAFVVDANSISRNGPEVAEHLHLVLHALMSLPSSQVLPQLIILAHKTDLLERTTASSAASASALAITRVRTILERELEKRRQVQSGGVGVEGLGAEGERTELGGLECNNGATVGFKFDDWEGGEVVFLGTSTTTTRPITDWLEQNTP